MATAVQWLSNPRKHRVYYLYGSDCALRVDVLSKIEEVVLASYVRRLSMEDVSDSLLWRDVFTVPLSDISSRLFIVYDIEKIKEWDKFPIFLNDSRCYDTTLVLVSLRDEQGKRVRVSDPRKLSGFEWRQELFSWEQLIKDKSSCAYINCQTPSLEVSRTKTGNGTSSVARWLSYRVGVTQKQAEYVWNRSGGSSVLARDVIDTIKLLGVSDAQLLRMSDFSQVVDSILTLQGTDDFGELLLFNKRSVVMSLLRERDFTSLEWGKVLGYLSQRLDWLDPLYGALTTNERLDQVSSRLGIHVKWILHYAHRENPEHNIAKHYTKVRVSRCRQVLAYLDSMLSRFPGVPPAFGETLVALW